LFFVWFGDISAVLKVFWLVQFVFDRFGGFASGFMVLSADSSWLSTNLMVFQHADKFYKVFVSIRVRLLQARLLLYMYKLQLEGEC
jgi:hypothetical protein